MAVKVGFMPNKGYVKMDNAVCRIRGLSDGAVRLYVLIAGMMNGRNITDIAIGEALGWSNYKVTQTKNELKKVDLLYVHQVGKNFYYMFIGSTQYKASAIYRKLGTDFEGKPVTMDDMQKRLDDIQEDYEC